ncbi:MAG: hypothetical protein Fur0034_03160 [Desulfuromonadia bacterium]
MNRYPSRVEMILTIITAAAGILSLWIAVSHFQGAPPLNGVMLGGAFTAIVCIALLYRHQLNRIEGMRQNLEAAQQLAEIGSWERDIRTGAGYWSPERFRLFGLEPRDTAPTIEEFYTMIHPEDREPVREAISTAIDACGCYSVEYRRADDPTGQIFCSRGVVLPDGEGRPVRIIGMTQNITPRKRLEEAHRDLVVQRTLFIRRLGHDLNTPLTPLVALLPMIRERATDPKQREWIDTCIASTNSIRHLVTSAMQLARRSSPDHRLVMTTFPLSLLIEEVIAEHREMIREHGLTILTSVPPDLTVRADRSEIALLVTHLINNVLAYTPCGAVMEITTSASEKGVTVSVSDNGAGLSPDECSQIFDEFYRGDPARHDRGASGLGLSICRRIIQNHGERIWARSTPNTGTTISFTLRRGVNDEPFDTDHDRR